jgi:hypothetical protein
MFVQSLFVCSFKTDISSRVLDLPSFGAIALMLNKTYFARHNTKALQTIIFNFAAPRRIGFHMLSVVARAILTPVLQLVFGIAVKRLLGLNTACSAADTTQLTRLRRYVTSVLLSPEACHKAFKTLGSHYEIVSVSKILEYRVPFFMFKMV